jgi:hypothetical protein
MPHIIVFIQIDLSVCKLVSRNRKFDHPILGLFSKRLQLFFIGRIVHKQKPPLEKCSVIFI